MQKIRKKGKLIHQFSTTEYAAIVNQTAQNIRYKAKNNRFKTELTGVSAVQIGYDWIIEVDVNKNFNYLESTIKK